MKLYCTIAALGLLALTTEVNGLAQNLVINPGFETGNSSGYVVNNNNVTTENDGDASHPGPHSGTYYLSGGSVGSLAYTSQSIATAPGQRYILGLYFASDGYTANEFQLRFGGVTLFDQANVPLQGYTRYSYSVTATMAASLFEVGLRDDPRYLSVDDLFVYSYVNLGGTSGLTPNQNAVGTNLDSIAATPSGGTADFVTTFLALDALPPGALGAALDQLSPEKFGYFTSVTAFNNASFETEAMDNYLAGLRNPGNGAFLAGNGQINSSGLTVNDPNYDSSLALIHSRMLAWNPAPASGVISDIGGPALGGVAMRDSKDMKDMKEMAPAYTDPWNFFVRGNVILAQGFSQPGVSHFDDNTESVELGTDYRITPNFLVGLTAGYAHTDVTLDNNGSSATVDSYSPGFYAAYADHGWYANLSGDYLHNAYTQSRNIAFLGQTANSAPEGNEGVANLDGGYDFHHGALTFGPLAGIQYTHLSVDGFSETGSIADLTVADQQSDSLRSRLGGRVSYAYDAHGTTITPHLDASWQHEFLDQSRGITSSFNGFGGGSFAVKTPNPSRESALADAGVDADLNRTVTVFADYIAQAGQDNYFGQSVQAGVKIGF